MGAYGSRGWQRSEGYFFSFFMKKRRKRRKRRKNYLKTKRNVLYDFALKKGVQV